MPSIQILNEQITNLIAALMPIIAAGAEDCANKQIGDAVQKAQENRAARRAKK